MFRHLDLYPQLLPFIFLYAWLGHFQFARYLNDLVDRSFEKDSPNGVQEDQIRFHILYREKVCHKYILLAIQHYAAALRRDMKHVYQALPRLLSLWFDFVSVEAPNPDDVSTPDALNPRYLSKFRLWFFSSVRMHKKFPLTTIPS